MPMPGFTGPGLYLFLSEWFVKAMTAGAIKG